MKSLAFLFLTALTLGLHISHAEAKPAVANSQASFNNSENILASASSENNRRVTIRRITPGK